MKKAIVWAFSLRKAELEYKVWCHLNNVSYRIRDAIFLSSNMPLSWNQERIRGYWKDVMEDRIKLINISKEYFEHIYQGI